LRGKRGERQPDVVERENQWHKGEKNGLVDKEMAGQRGEKGWGDKTMYLRISGTKGRKNGWLDKVAGKRGEGSGTRGWMVGPTR
jgi:hypothetical protein